MPPGAPAVRVSPESASSPAGRNVPAAVLAKASVAPSGSVTATVEPRSDRPVQSEPAESTDRPVDQPGPKMLAFPVEGSAARDGSKVLKVRDRLSSAPGPDRPASEAETARLPVIRSKVPEATAAVASDPASSGSIVTVGVAVSAPQTAAPPPVGV